MPSSGAGLGFFVGFAMPPPGEAYMGAASSAYNLRRLPMPELGRVAGMRVFSNLHFRGG